MALKDDLSYTRGKHNLKFGYSYQYQREVGTGQQNISGVSGYSFLGTSVPGATSETSGNSFASFLLGWADSGGTQTNRYLPQIFPYNGFYAQDDWHVTQRLTLNLGLRYEFTLPPTATGNQYSDFSPTTPNPAVNNYLGAVIYAGFGPGTQNARSLVPGWYGAIGPRLGLAYSLDSKTTIRAGFGRSFGKVTTPWGSSHYAGFVGSYSFSSGNQDNHAGLHAQPGAARLYTASHAQPGLRQQHRRGLLAGAIRYQRRRRCPELDPQHPAPGHHKHAGGGRL